MLLKRFKSHLEKKSKLDLFRKIISFFIEKTKVFFFTVRKTRSLYFFKHGGVKIEKGVVLKGIAYDVHIGKGLHLYSNCIIEIRAEDAILRIGDNCLFSYGVLLSCGKSVTIGNDVMIGEYTSIRDSTHVHSELGQAMKNAKDVTMSVEIGSNVWIGRGCIIMPGSVVEDGVVVAANSVVKGRLEKNNIYGGCPARFIKQRNNT